MEKSSYLKFTAMMAVSFVVMYAVMFLNADVFDHVMLSTTRTYMTILMIAPMAVSMLLFMWKMYKNKVVNYIILGASVIVFASTLFMLRNQTLITDVQWMKVAAIVPRDCIVKLPRDKSNQEARRVSLIGDRDLSIGSVWL